MSNAELVKRLRYLHAHFGVRLPISDCQAIEDAITALSSQDDVRDRALEEEVAFLLDQLDAYAVTLSSADQSKLRDFVLVSTLRIRALKSKPTTEERRTGDTQPPAPEVKQGLREAFQQRFGCTVGEFETYSAIRQPGDHVVLAWLVFMLSTTELDTRLGGKNV